MAGASDHNARRGAELWLIFVPLSRVSVSLPRARRARPREATIHRTTATAPVVVGSGTVVMT